MSPASVELPALFGADPRSDVFFHAYSNGGKAVRTRVSLTHHLLSLVQDGEKEVLVAERREHVDASRSLLLSATASIMSEHSLEGRPMRSVLLFLAPSFVLDFSLRHGMEPRAQAEGLVALEQDAFTHLFARSIELLGCATLNADPALRRTKAEEILLYLCAKHPLGMAGFLAAAVKDERGLSFRHVIARHEGGNLSVPELAFLCHMSVSTFKRHFLEVFRVSPGRYFHERRMIRAKGMLERRLRPSQIFLELGYESLSAFSTEFKKHFGVAPTTMR